MGFLNAHAVSEAAIHFQNLQWVLYSLQDLIASSPLTNVWLPRSECYQVFGQQALFVLANPSPLEISFQVR